MSGENVTYIVHADDDAIAQPDQSPLTELFDLQNITMRSEGPDQNAQMCRVIWTLAARMWYIYTNWNKSCSLVTSATVTPILS